MVVGGMNRSACPARRSTAWAHSLPSLLTGISRRRKRDSHERESFRHQLPLRVHHWFRLRDVPDTVHAIVADCGKHAVLQQNRQECPVAEGNVLHGLQVHSTRGRNSLDSSDSSASRHGAFASLTSGAPALCWAISINLAMKSVGSTSQKAITSHRRRPQKHALPSLDCAPNAGKPHHEYAQDFS